MNNGTLTTTPLRLKPWIKGDKLTAEHFDQPVQALNRMLSGASPGRQIVSPPVPTGGAVQTFKFKVMAGDYIMCRMILADGTEAVVDTPVAKPPLLRRSVILRDGISFSYSSDVDKTATKGSDIEEWNVISGGGAAYILDDLIFASAPIGGTGIFLDGIGGEGGVPVIWQDLNVDARAWAEEEA